jgi:protein ImuB
VPRIACLDLPALPLQLVWRAEPAWRDHPVVVVDEDRPAGRVRWACERARAAGILPNHRYGHALGLCAGLRARVVPPEVIDAAIVELRRVLHALSPRVEPADAQPGTFWLDGEGLARIFVDPGATPPGTAWARAIADAVAGCGLVGAIVVGASRFATYAIARARGAGVTVLVDDAAERATARAVPLARLDVDPRLRDALGRLGVTTVGQLVRLPAGGILERFGKEAHRLYQLAAGERWDPLVPEAPPEAPDERVILDDEERDLEGLVFLLKGALDRLLLRLAARGRALTVLHVELALKHGVGRVERRVDNLKPAAPTLDGRALLRLVHLRLTGDPPAAGVNALRVWADDVAATREQLALFAARPRRDLRAADEAIARLRAELGDDAVVRAVLREGHLPEARFGWERVSHVVTASPQPRLVRPLIRRLATRPVALPPQDHGVRDDGWLLSGLAHGAVVRIVGPYVVSGGWWASEIHREYHFAETRRGDCLWVYYDRGRRRWFLHGEVS